MKCRKCKHQLKNDALFCGRCGAKVISIDKLASLLKLIAIVGVIIQGTTFVIPWSMHISWWFFHISRFYFLYNLLDRTLAVLFLGICIAVIVIKFAKNNSKAGFLKKMSIAYLMLTVINFILMFIIGTPNSYKVGFNMTHLYLAWDIIYFIAPFIIPTIYVIFTSKIHKLYLQSKEDD